MMVSGTTSKSQSKKPGKASLSALTPKLETSLVVAKDLKDQGASELILLTGAGRPVYYAVDSFEEHWGAMCFYCSGKLVYVCRKEGAWAIVSREVANITTEAEYVKAQHADTKVQEAFYKELDPEAFKMAEKIAEAGGLEALLGGGQAPHAHLGVKEDGKPVPGQYL